MELETKQSIDWIKDPYGRQDQIQRQLRSAETMVQDMVNSFGSKVQAIAQLEDENRQQIKTQAEKAYQAVENVVSILLTVNGDHRLSREDASIMALLQESVQNFEHLCTISRENKDELGIKAGDCKELGDCASRLSRSFGKCIAAFSTDAIVIWTSCKDYNDKWQAYHNDEENHRFRVRDKQSSLDDLGNQFLNFFDSGVGDRLQRELQEAEGRLTKNLEEQQQAKDTSESYSRLALTTKNVGSAFQALKQQLEHTSTQFSDEYVKVIEAQNVETNLWTGLLDLKNKIWSTDYTSTRDRSLRQLLNLLTLDDKVFMRQEFFENTETRIKDSIRKHLGADAVEKLITGKSSLISDHGELGNW